MDQNVGNFSSDLKEVLVRLKTTEKGLSSKEAQNRLSLYGPNILVEKHPRPIILDAILHSVNPLVAILLIAAIIAAFTGNPLNAGIIVSIVLLSIIIDYFQSHRSLTAAKRLRAQVAVTSTVFRDQGWQEIPLHEVVPGDVIHLTAGL
jgi:P-type Mg2+ transporter